MFIYYTLPPFYELKLFNTCVSLSGVSHLLINRYKRLLCMVDLTKDFFFSYSFNIMRSFQKNICDRESGGTLYKKMFVWNEFLTRGIRHHLRNTVWTVALVYGFFKQVRIVYFSAPHCQSIESFPEIKCSFSFLTAAVLVFVYHLLWDHYVVSCLVLHQKVCKRSIMSHLQILIAIHLF